MKQEKIFKRLILYKSILLGLIIIWGGSVQLNNASNPSSNNLTDLGGLFFSLFSIFYILVSYQLYKFKALGKKLFAPLILLFIVLGFLSEITNPMEINENLFYLFVFYIVSPLFFVAQGVVAGMLYFSNLSEHFETDKSRN